MSRTGSLGGAVKERSGRGEPVAGGQPLTDAELGTAETGFTARN